MIAKHKTKTNNNDGERKKWMVGVTDIRTDGAMEAITTNGVDTANTPAHHQRTEVKGTRIGAKEEVGEVGVILGNRTPLQLKPNV